MQERAEPARDHLPEAAGEGGAGGGVGAGAEGVPGAEGDHQQAEREDRPPRAEQVHADAARGAGWEFESLNYFMRLKRFESNTKI